MIMTAATLVIAIAQAPSSEGLSVHCSGGVRGMNRVVHLSSNGQLSQSQQWNRGPAPIGTIPPAEARALITRLEKVDFLSLPDLPRNSQIRDGINCAIIRSGPRGHTVRFPAGSWPKDRYRALRYAEVKSVMSAIFSAADRLRLNPQPIPPDEAAIE